MPSEAPTNYDGEVYNRRTKASMVFRQRSPMGHEGELLKSQGDLAGKHARKLLANRLSGFTGDAR